MWVRTNNYKFHTFHSVHFHSAESPRPSFRFSEGLVPRLPKVYSLVKVVRVQIKRVPGFRGPNFAAYWRTWVIDGAPQGFVATRTVQPELGR